MLFASSYTHHLPKVGIAVLFAFLPVLTAPFVAPAQPVAVPVNGFYIRTLPSGYPAQERFLSGLKDSGADQIILELPATPDGKTDTALLSSAVYLAHRAGLKISVVMPTRQLPGVIAEHPEWEDLHYDLSSGSVRRSGQLDLFHPEAFDRLIKLAKTIAAYSVDGILLGSDFQYRATDGLGTTAVAVGAQRLGGPVGPKDMFPNISKGPNGPVIDRYGPRFTAWAAMKRDRMTEVVAAVQRAARSVKPGITVGVPVPLVLPVAVPAELLARYSFDINAYRQLGVDHYWSLLDYQDLRERQTLTVRQCMEVLSRTARAAITTVREPERLILVMPAVTTSGKALTLSEIEEATELARQCGRTGIAYVVGPGAVPPPALTKKLFRPEKTDSEACIACDAQDRARKNGKGGSL